MRRTRFGSELTSSPILAGAVALLLGGIGTFLSYNANRGLPFVPTYDISVDVPDAAELVKADEVRIGGARVGQITDIQAHPGSDGRAPYARLHLALDRGLGPVPVDTAIQVRPRSILGAKYLSLSPGHSSRKLHAGGVIGLRQVRPVVEFDEAFQIFDHETARGIRGSVGGLADALAGRGSSLNETVGAASRLLPPLQRVLGVLVSPRTDLRGFVQGAAATLGALAPVSPTLAALVDHGATTLAALNAAGDSLGRTIEEIPPTEIVGTRTLTRVTPVLADASAIARAIRPGTRVLPVAAPRLAVALEAATPTLRQGAGLADRLGATLASLDRLASDPAAAGSVRKLITTVTSLASTLRVLGPAQRVCNVAGIWTRNVPSSISQGDSNGAWFRGILLLGTTQIQQAAQPDPTLHVNFYPHETASECESGNEPYAPGQAIGNPAGNQSTTVDQTSPPAGVRELAAKAGLLAPTPGAHP